MLSVNRFSILCIALVFGLLTLGFAGPAGNAPNQTRYIVVFHPHVQAAQAAPALANAHGLNVIMTYNHALQGMAVTVPAGRLNALRNDPRVAYIEVDRVVTIAAQTVPTGIDRIFATGNSNLDIDGVDDYRVDVDVAVIDTGVDFQHPDLNVVGGVDCTVSSGGGPPWARNYYCSSTAGTGGDDNHYHGTHVAGTIGAIDNNSGVVGVAPGARIWAVKVLDSSGSGYESGIIAGIDWITANAATIDVANMSLGGSGYSQAEYDAIQAAVNAGVAFAVAAGNSDANASGFSPAAFDNVLTVSALADFDGLPGGLGSPTCRTDQDDTLADFSNWGSAVDIAAPGVCILSTYPIEQGSYGTISGTSMASPHVAGALALLASVNKPQNANDVYALYNAVTSAGNFNWVDDSGDGIKEPLLDVTGFPANLIATGTTPNNPPTVSITSPANGASFTSGSSINFTGTASDTEDGNLSSSIAWSSNQDGALGTGSSITVVLSDGTHTITASVTDSANQTSTASISVTVTASGGGGGGGITLAATGYKVQGRWHADLTWSGATTTNVDIYVNGAYFTTTANDGAHTYSSNTRGGGSLTFQICEASTSNCSNSVTVNY